MLLKAPANKVTANEPWAEIPCPPFVVVNNTWGASSNELIQSVSAAQTTAGSEVRFSWDIRGAKDKVYGFPNITFGKHPWSQESTTSALPKLVTESLASRIAFTSKLSTKGKANTCLDMWLTSAPPHGPEQIVCEVMVWLRTAGGMVPHGSRYDKETDQKRFQHYFGKAAWPVVSFVYTGNAFADFEGIGIPLHYFLWEALRKTRRLTKPTYLSAVEAGCEVCSGKGTAVIGNLSIDGIEGGKDGS